VTRVGSGGVVIRTLKAGKTFERDVKKLAPDYRHRLKEKLGDLLKDPRPPGLGFEKLKGHNSPPIYTCHIDGNYKFSFEIEGDVAFMRRAGTHNDIDRAP